jgi:hypothetical protein
VADVADNDGAIGSAARVRAQNPTRIHCQLLQTGFAVHCQLSVCRKPGPHFRKRIILMMRTYPAVLPQCALCPAVGPLNIRDQS